MELEPEILKKLIETFREELTEQAQLITDGLLMLEKNSDQDNIKTIETIFRAAHNIKGASRSVGINEIGNIAHGIESLFSSVQKNEVAISADIINSCLAAVDNMQTAMQTFIEKSLPTKREQNLNQPTQQISSTIATQETPFSQENKDYESIRVTLSDLDQVSVLTEEMQVSKIAISEHFSELSALALKLKEFNYLWKQTSLTLKRFSDQQAEENLQKLYHLSNDRLTEITSATNLLHKNMFNNIKKLTTVSNLLQEEVRLLRLVPASTLLRTLPRLIRDLAHELNKQVEVEIKDDGVKIDKMVLEGLKDPLIHLLRNAVDHGLETPAIRTAQGKSANCHVVLFIRKEGNQILIDIQDDGAGIDIEKIKTCALKKNIITQTELDNMSEKDILELIFRPGFSTKEIITNISGRGVGLDIVKSNIEYLKGQVSVSTKLAKGTTFHIRVPLTLASERGLMITSGGQKFVIPMSGIARVLILHPKDILEIEGNQAILIGQHPLSLRILSNLLGLERKEPAIKDRLYIVILKKGWHEIAVIVEEVIGEREIVVKPLHAPLSNVSCAAGGTLLGNGLVVIVLNTHDLIEKALHLNKIDRITLNDEVKKPPKIPHILVVDDSITTRTLEKNVLESKNYKVTTAVNGEEAWNLLQREKFSLLITDVTMPVMDGFTLTERVKQSKKLQNLPVIIVTSLNSHAEKKRGVEVGADAYVVKSEFESGSLLEIITQLV